MAGNIGLSGAIGAMLLLAGCATATAPPPATAAAPESWRAALDDPALAGTRWGLLVVDEDGREIAAIAPDERFVPASNTKMVTIATAFAEPGLLDAPIGGTAVALHPRGGGGVDVVLIGAGDPLLGDGADCVRDCLAELADAVAAKTRSVGNVIGDDTLYPDERWGPGWSWNNLPTSYGTAVSALTLNDNVTTLTVTPGATPAVANEDGWYRVDNHVRTGATTQIAVDRLPGSRRLRLSGTIAAGSPPEIVRLGVDDPAQWAAHRFIRLLRARGVAVTGEPLALHRAAGDAAPPPRAILARLTPRDYADAVRDTMKISQNLYAELMLRRVAAARGDRGTADGLAAVEAMFAAAGAPRHGWDLSDGSGMSTYNRLSPRAVVAMLRWTVAQHWGDAYRAILPVAGVDGTLSGRFRNTPLETRLFAKTGSLNGVAALSGFFTTASGRTFTFSSFANDRPAQTGSATEAIERALNVIAARH